MSFFLYFTIFAIVLQSCFSVHPGDPFPIDRSELKLPTSEDLMNSIETEHPIDDEVPSPSETPADPFDSSNDVDKFIDYVSTVSTKTVPTTKLHKINLERKFPERKTPLSTTKSTTTVKLNDNHIDQSSTLLQETSTSIPVKSFNKKNLIKIGRWKYTDPRTKETRYWYEPDGGHMGFGWKFDGFMFQVYNKSEPDTEPVYGFHSEIRAVWTNTVQMDPRPPIVGSDQWISDGVICYGYRTSMNSTELQPVFRYWNKLQPGITDHIKTRITYLTAKTQDKNVEDHSEWIFDKILFYALPSGY